MSTKKGLRLSRRHIKGNLIRFIEFLESPAANDKVEVQERLNVASLLLNKFETVQAQLEELDQPQDEAVEFIEPAQEEIEQRLEFENHYYKCSGRSSSREHK